MKTAAEIREKIEDLSAIPTLPDVLVELLAIIDKEDVSMKQVGEFINRDQALSTRILKMVNSPIYGFPGRISSVNQALMLIGLGAVKGMLMGVAIFDAMQQTMKGLWEHSLGTAAVARLIAGKVELKDVEEASVAGLIHDLGKVALGICYPAEYPDVLGKARSEGVYIAEAEREFFGVDHAEAGSWMARKWNFPKNLVEAIRYHHKPSLARENPKLAATIHLADSIIKAMGFGFSGDAFVHDLDREAWQTLGLSDEDLLDVVTQAEEAVSGESVTF